LCAVGGVGLLLVPVLEAAVPEHVAEAAALLLLGTAGAIGLAASTDLLQAVVGLETLALSAVTLVALGAGARALEAAFKYLVLGAISLAGLLFGLGLVILGTGSLGFPTATQVAGSPLVLAADLRRMLAYSAVTHAGFIGLALGSGPNGPTTAAFYAAVYGSMAMLVFAALAGQREPQLRSLGPFRAVALALGLFSLGGIPPTPGFWAKLAVLVVAWQAAGPLPTLIAIAGGVFSVLYYLRPLPDLFAAVRGDGAPARPVLVPGVLVAALAVVGLGLFPGI